MALLEKAKKLTFYIENMAPFRPLLLKNLKKFEYRFFKTNTIYWPPVELPGQKSARCSPVSFDISGSGEMALPRYIFLKCINK
jgi:hypothetical protein